MPHPGRETGVVVLSREAFPGRVRPAARGALGSPTLGFTHLQFEALLTAACQSSDPCAFALVAMLGLLGLRIFDSTGADITGLGEEHGHRVLRVCGKGTKGVLVPLPPAVGRGIDRAIGDWAGGPILFNSRGTRTHMAPWAVAVADAPVHAALPLIAERDRP